jgi:starch synthase
MRIIHIAAEFAPFAKAGGLGEVVTGLCRQLTREYEEVEIILPKYSFIPSHLLQNLNKEKFEFPCMEKGRFHANTMWSAQAENCRLYLLETDHPDGYFERPHIYGYPDDLARFIYFSKAALEYLKVRGEEIDILHLHEWHTALCAPLVKEDLARELNVRSVIFTIHNLEYQGKCDPKDLDALGISGKKYLTPDRLQDNIHPQNLNLLKGAIVYSDAITAVSPGYAQEILTPLFGCHLDSTLLKHKGKLTGILNGIDEKLWDPSKDPSLTAHFSAEHSLFQIDQAKTANKEALAKRFHLASKKRPWVGAVTRLVPQKGPEMLEEALHYTLQSGGVFILLGSSPIEAVQEHFEALKERYNGNRQVLLQLNYDEPLAHQIYAALDFSLIPSHFEPCGLTQLISMRYGTIPIVRSTGGLRDTVFDYDNYKVPSASRNGFSFLRPKELQATLQRAFALLKDDPDSFHSLMKRAMQTDSSWKKPAAEYKKLYLAVSKKTQPVFLN